MYFYDRYLNNNWWENFKTFVEMDLATKQHHENNFKVVGQIVLEIKFVR